MISRSLSSVARSPPLTSGWWRFTRSLKRALISALSAPSSSPSSCSALRSALRTVRCGSVRVRVAGCGAHLPGRAMTGHRVLLILHHGVFAHAGEVIVGMVVLADVLEAEAPVLVLPRTTLRRAMRRRVAAAFPLAARLLRRAG